MKLENDSLKYSISDVIRYFKSPYASWATWANLMKPNSVFVENEMLNNTSLLLRSEENEADAKRYLINNYSTVKQISNPLESYRESKELIDSKVDVIVQATINRDQFEGRADFLIFDKEQDLYEVMDAKLAKQIKPEFLLQVCGYTWMLESYQTSLPKNGWFFLGNENVEYFKLSEFYKFFIDLKEEFLETVNNYSLESHPTPRKWETFEEYNDAALMYWKKNKSLELIADISKRQVEILEKEGVKTITNVPRIKAKTLPKISSETLDKIKRQASAQLASDENKTHIELRNAEESIHHLHTLMPDEQNGDIYFDLEGHPFYDIRSEYTMEYLYGVAYKDEKGNLKFKDDLWADNEAEEEQIFIEFVDWVQKRIKKYPNLKIYHYAHYEKTSLLKSAQKFGKNEIIIDNWLREGRLIDLYQVIRKAFIIGKDSYGLKRIEEIPGYIRELDLNSGIDSIYYFERYLANRSQEIKEEILLYNKDDCFATEAVCTWLREMKKEYEYDFEYIEPSPSEPQDIDIEILGYEEKIKKIKTTSISKDHLNFISTMMGYYRREKKVDIWEKLDLLSLPKEEKINNPNSFGILKLVEPPQLRDSKYFLTYECHDNTFKKLKEGDEVILLVPSSQDFLDIQFYVSVYKITDNPFTIIFTLTEKKWNEIHEYDESVNFYFESISGIINPDPIKFRNVSTSPFNSLKAICDKFLEEKKLPSLVEQILDQKSKIEFQKYENALVGEEELYKLAINMDNTYLAIQGPPGTGKSTMLGKVIADLYHDGKSIGIVGPSYASTLNLVKKVIPHLKNNETVKFTGGNTEILNEIESLEKIEIIKDDKSSDAKLLATFVNKICHKRYLGSFDYIVIDEVGQVPLVTTLASTLSTKNIILIGDPNQLPQVKKGTQPNNNGLTTLEYLIGEDTILSEDKGIFLNTTYRMHSDVNQFISDYFYDGKLKNHKLTDKRTLRKQGNKINSTGIQFISVPHVANIQASFEEIDTIEKLTSNLLKTEIIEDGKQRKLKEEDILIVSPYNLQVYELKKRLSENFKIGTVDKFQGQEAPVVIVSLAASNYEEAPRGIDFILNFNRMNVALSRSQCLSIVVGSPELTHLHYQSLNSIRLTNFHRTLMSSS